MEQCKYCKEKFKRVANHTNKCPTKLSMTPCPHCNKLFKRVASHVYRCPEKPEEKGKTMKNDVSSEGNDDDNGEVSNMTPCPHCKKMFKRVAAHVYRCPHKPEENREISDGNTSEEEEEESKEKRDISNGEENAKKHEEKGQITNGKENGKMPDGKTITNDSSSEEEDEDNGEAANMTPCPHCKKMFKRVACHIYRCPQKPKENGEIPDAKTIKTDSSSDEDEDEENVAMTPCPHCKKIFKFVEVHISNCSVRSDKDIREKKVVDNTTDCFYKSVSTTKSSKNTVPKPLVDQFFAMPIFNSTPRPESEKGDHHELVRPPIQGDYLPSTMQKGPAIGNAAALSKSIPYSLSVKSYESWETESNSASQVTPRKLKRPPIHGNHSLHHEVQILDISGNEEGSLTDFSEDNSFYRSSESEDSFSYLHQDLKRPPIHKAKSKSSFQKESNKKLQLPTDEEEFFEFHHHVTRE